MASIQRLSRYESLFSAPSPHPVIPVEILRPAFFDELS
jgi:hypothetical protein